MNPQGTFSVWRPDKEIADDNEYATFAYAVSDRFTEKYDGMPVTFVYIDPKREGSMEALRQLFGNGVTVRAGTFIPADHVYFLQKASNRYPRLAPMERTPA